MKLAQLFKEAEMSQVNFSEYLNHNRPNGLPPLNIRKLTLQALAGKDRFGISTPYDGTGTLVVRYKGKEGGLVSIDEQEDGETWDVVQVQGAKTKKSYRVATGLHWHLLLGRRARDYATHPEAEVRQIIMQPTFDMKNIDGARSEFVGRGYNVVKNVLEMRWSEGLKLFVADIRNGVVNCR